MLESRVSAAPRMPHPCVKCAFYDVSIWQPVADGGICSLARGFSRKELEPGQLLFKQGDENRGIFCVSSGLLALRSHHVDGTSTLMRLAYPGEVVGFRSFLGKYPHQTEARALLPSRVCTVVQGTAARIMTQSPETLGRLAERCVAEIDRNHERIIATATRSNKVRLADLLQRLMAVHGRQDGEVIRMHLPLSRMDLADLIGVQPETMSRLVKRLELDGVFVFSGRDVQMSSQLSGSLLGDLCG